MMTLSNSKTTCPNCKHEFQLEGLWVYEVLTDMPTYCPWCGKELDYPANTK